MINAGGDDDITQKKEKNLESPLFLKLLLSLLFYINPIINGKAFVENFYYITDIQYIKY